MRQIIKCPSCKSEFTEEDAIGHYVWKCPTCGNDCSDQNPIQPEGMCEGWTWQDVEDEML